MITRTAPVIHTFMAKNPLGFHKIAYYAWGNPANPVLIMVHALSRNGRDFDVIAEALSDRYYVICPDMVGRGLSDWLPQGFPQGEDYTYDQYMYDLTVLIARLNVREVSWLGTSMGGLLGMILAALPGTPIKKLVINDIGPFIKGNSLEKIRNYISLMPTFSTFDSGLKFIKQIYGAFGHLTTEQWAHLAEHSFTKNPDGTYRLHYDPRIALFKNTMPDVNLWPCWLAVQCPTLVIRGSASEIFPADICSQMITSNPYAVSHEINGPGHAPALMSDYEISLVRNWFVEKWGAA